MRTGPGTGKIGRYALFQEQRVEAPAVRFTYSLAANDFNRDGKSDLAFVKDINNIGVLLSTGSSFAAVATYACGINLPSVSTADVNGDGWPDQLVPQQFTQSFAVLLGSRCP